MFELPHRVRRLVSGMLARHSAPSLRRFGVGPSVDWLPPVLDPGAWSVAMMADRSAGWYFDRR